jgi:putative FmdB family regulatory protein
MPLYEYQCDECGDLFEVIQKFSDEPLTTHEGCGGHVVRLISPAALHFKGTGWYVTDYAHKNGSSPNGRTETKTDTKSESKSEPKSESKSQPKSESKNGSAAKTESKTPAK